MWFPDLSDPGISHETAFVLLAWAELFGEHTPNTYAPRLHDVISIAGELAVVARQAETNGKWLYHLHPIIEELQAAASVDPVLSRFYPQQQYAILTLEKNVSAARARHFAEVIEAQTQDYEARVFENFTESVGLLPKQKEKAFDAVRRLATRAVQRGLGREELRGSVNKEMLRLSSQEAAATLLGNLERQQREWTCIVGIEGESSDVEALLNSVGFNALPNRQKPLGEIGKTFLEKTARTFHGVCRVEAQSSMEAVQFTLNSLRLVLDAANFAHRSAVFKIAPFVYLESNGAKQQIVNLEAGADAGIEPQHAATEHTVDLQRAGVLAKLPQRILTTLEQHSVAYASTDPKVRFVNLWVALETLVGHEPEGKIIDHVNRRVTPVIIHRRVNKIIKYAAICLHRFGFCDKVPDATGWFKKSSKLRVRADELLLALAGAAGTAVADELAKITVPHPLLCNRLYQIHKVVFDPVELGKELVASSQRSQWQLFRIYRARNLLVHTGETVPLLSKLSADLEYYYSLTLSRILHDFERYENWSIEKSFEHRKQMFDFLSHKLRTKDSQITVGDVLEHDSGKLGRHLVWESAL